MKDSFNSKKDEETIKKGRPFERRFPLANNATIFQVLSLHNFDVTPSDLPYIRRLIMSLVRHINMAKCAREQRLLVRMLRSDRTSFVAGESRDFSPKIFSEQAFLLQYFNL